MEKKNKINKKSDELRVLEFDNEQQMLLLLQEEKDVEIICLEAEVSDYNQR